MQTENTPPIPTSIVLISIFWILIGTCIVAIYSRYLSTPYNDYLVLLGIMPFMVGIGLIMVGWGLLTCRKWALYTALLFSLFGLLISIIPLSGMVVMFFSAGRYSFRFETVLWSSSPLLIFLLFAFMFGFLIKNKKYFEKKQ